MAQIDLDTPLTLPCGAVLPNRFAKGAMTEGVADPGNAATKRHARLYKRWAEGGLGLSITGNVMVDRRYMERPGNLAIDGKQTAQQMKTLTAMADAGKSAGGHIWMQISHAGRQTTKAVAAEPVAPSAVGEVALPGGRFGKPRALTGEEIIEIIGRYTHAAVVAKRAGFNGVQIHAAHGYLISEFLNPLINQRTDEWGGNLEGRSRLLLEIIKSVREQVGPDYPVSVKLNSSDFQKGGFTLTDSIAVIKLLEAASVDLIEISGGNYEQPRMMGIEGLEPVYEDEAMIKSSTSKREAYFLNYAVAIREAVSVPLMVIGGFRTRDAMLSALNDDKIALIGIARPVCARPDLPKQMIAGEIDTMPSDETTLALGPGWLGPKSSNPTMRAINGFANMSYFYRNIIRMADGKKPKVQMNLMAAFIKHQMTDDADAKRLK